MTRPYFISFFCKTRYWVVKDTRWGGRKQGNKQKREKEKGRKEEKKGGRKRGKERKERK